MKSLYLFIFPCLLFIASSVFAQQMDVFLVSEPTENTEPEERIYRFSVRETADTLIEYYAEPDFGDVQAEKPKAGTIEDSAYRSDFFVYPNPFDNVLYIEVEDLSRQDFWVVIYNRKGEKFIAEDLTINKSRLEFDTSEFPNEQYFIAIGSDDEDYRFSVRKY